MTLRKRLARQGPAAVLAVLTAAFIALSFQYGEESRTLPLLVAWTTLVLTIIEFVSQGDSRLGCILRTTLSGDQSHPAIQDAQRIPVGREIGAFAWVTSVLVAVMLFGFYLTIPVFVVGFLRFYARKSLILALSVATVLTSLVWVLFEVILGYRLFFGFVFGDF